MKIEISKCIIENNIREIFQSYYIVLKKLHYLAKKVEFSQTIMTHMSKWY